MTFTPDELRLISWMLATAVENNPDAPDLAALDVKVSEELAA